MTVLQIVFLLMAAAAIAGSIMVVSARKLVHAALWLVVVLATIAALFVLLEASFLAVVQVVVYIGAIAILIIFTIMLTRRVMHDDGPQVNRNWWASALVALLLFGSLMLLFTQLPGLSREASELSMAADAPIEELGQSLVDVNRYVLPFEVASVLLVAALIGAIVVARPPKRDEQQGGEP
ncbi:MAG: NADH-quinone oxidoreductase subunit J [Anaerolineales bacterium]|jgi:NADH-quinone oxidoreductase subunit J